MQLTHTVTGKMQQFKSAQWWSPWRTELSLIPGNAKDPRRPWHAPISEDLQPTEVIWGWNQTSRSSRGKPRMRGKKSVWRPCAGKTPGPWNLSSQVCFLVIERAKDSIQFGAHYASPRRRRVHVEEKAAPALLCSGDTLLLGWHIFDCKTRNDGLQSHPSLPFKPLPTESSPAALCPGPSLSPTIFGATALLWEGSRRSHLPASCPWPGTSDSDSTGSGSADACRWGSLCYPDTCRWGLSLWFSWRTPCSLHSCTHHSAFLLTRKEQSLGHSCVGSFIQKNLLVPHLHSPHTPGKLANHLGRKQRPTSRNCRLIPGIS